MHLLFLIKIEMQIKQNKNYMKKKWRVDYII